MEEIDHTKEEPSLGAKLGGAKLGGAKLGSPSSAATTEKKKDDLPSDEASQDDDCLYSDSVFVGDDSSIFTDTARHIKEMRKAANSDDSSSDTIKDK